MLGSVICSKSRLASWSLFFLFFYIAFYLKYGGFECPECPPAQNYSSLDGNGSEFLDGDRVVLKGRENVIYTVSRSFIAVVSDSNYTILYDLVSSDGYKVTCPEALLTLYVAPVVTTP